MGFHDLLPDINQTDTDNSTEATGQAYRSLLGVGGDLLVLTSLNLQSNKSNHNNSYICFMCGCTENKPTISNWKTIKEGVRAAPRVAKQIANKQFVPQEVFEERLAICVSNECEKFQPEGHRCRSCTCFLKAKTRLSLEECPEGKWKKYEQEG